MYTPCIWLEPHWLIEPHISSFRSCLSIRFVQHVDVENLEWHHRNDKYTFEQVFFSFFFQIFSRIKQEKVTLAKITFVNKSSSSFTLGWPYLPLLHVLHLSVKPNLNFRVHNELTHLVGSALTSDWSSKNVFFFWSKYD